MNEREREREREPIRAGSSRPEEPGQPEPGDVVSPTRQEAIDLARAGQDIIERTLTGNSLEFLRANRQRGGQ